MRRHKGIDFENSFSSYAHQLYVPVLISSKLLRSINAGQVDVAGLQKNGDKWLLRVFELKSSQYPSAAQLTRLKRSQEYLSKVLDIEVKFEVKFCQKAEA